MEEAWRQTHNTRRMDSAPSGSICRRFLNGSCRFGSRCNYRHERPIITSSQICRYFQKGGCWYGACCRYLHVLLPEADAAVSGRRSSVPAISSSSSSLSSSSSHATYAPPDRRGSEPALLQAQLTSRRECSRAESVVNVSNPQHNIGLLVEADNVEEQTLGTDSQVTSSSESVQSLEVDQACACEGRNRQETPSTETTEDGAAAAAASSPQGKLEEVNAFLKSKNVMCGICMDKVYEKVDPRSHMFGILPNCSHSFCLQCIKTWRKTKDLGPDVVKSCPQCRVRSPFYVPHKYWVEEQAKEKVIAAFKEKFSKISCGYYSRYGCCPFKTECLYRHNKRAASRRSFSYSAEEEDEYDSVDMFNLFIAMTLLAGDDGDDYDEFDFGFYLSEN